MKIDVSVIIVNYKTKNLIKDCLDSLFLHTKDIKFEVIVVDNNSNDNIEYMLDSEFPSVKFIQNKKNVGFGSANNVAINNAVGKYLFLLNPDTILLNNSVKYFYNYCEKNEGIGCVGGFLEDSNGNQIHSYGQFLNYWYDLLYILGYNVKKILNLKTKFIFPSYKKYDEYIKVDYVTGADLFIPSDVLTKVGLFDETFFMYSEETDLQYRMKCMGFDRVVIPDARIIHLEGKSFALSNSRRIMMNVSKMKYIRKHKGFFSYLLMKSVYFTSAIIGSLADCYYKEYRYYENIHYLRCLLNDEYK
ncbi:glycosyltransferase family 2 protein [Vibrio aestuarianus]|nr:glycosyltransferase family 2 protein [Vibrio aestuarianus]